MSAWSRASFDGSHIAQSLFPGKPITQHMANLATSYPMTGLVAVNVPAGTSDKIRFGGLGV